MEIKDWLNNDGFHYIGKALAKPDKDIYQCIYSNEKLKSVDAEVVLWVKVVDNMCYDVYYRISPGEVKSTYINFWNEFVKAESLINTSKSLSLDLEILPIDASSVTKIKDAVERVLQSFYAMMDAYLKDSKTYNFDNYDLPIFFIAKMSVMLTDKTPLDWFTLPDGAKLQSSITKLVRCKDAIKTQDNSDMCTVLENAMRMKKARISVLRSYFRGDSVQEYMDSANRFFNTQTLRRMYIPAMRKFFKDEILFSENYINYQSSTV